MLRQGVHIYDMASILFRKSESMRLNNVMFEENTCGMPREHMILVTSRLMGGNWRSTRKCGVIKDSALVNLPK